MDEVLSNIVSGLETLEKISSAVSAVPGLGAVTNAALTVVKTIQKVKANKEDAVRLAQRVEALMNHVHETVKLDPNAVDASLRADIHKLETTLGEVEADLEKQLRKKAWKRFLQHANIAKKINRGIVKLDDASKAFNTTSSIAIRQGQVRQTSEIKRTIVKCNVEVIKVHALAYSDSEIRHHRALRARIVTTAFFFVINHSSVPSGR